MANTSDQPPRLELYKWYEGPYTFPADGGVSQRSGRAPWCNSGTLWPSAWRCIGIEPLSRGVRIGRLAWCEVLTGAPCVVDARAERIVRQTRAGTHIRPSPAPRGGQDIHFIALRPPSLDRIVDVATSTFRRLSIAAWGDARECMSLVPGNAHGRSSQHNTAGAYDEVHRLFEAMRLSGELVRRGEPPVWEIEHAHSGCSEAAKTLCETGGALAETVRVSLRERFEALDQMTETALRADDQVRYWKTLAELWTLCQHQGITVSGAKLDKHYNG